jgi:hypothetical protein
LIHFLLPTTDKEWWKEGEGDKAEIFVLYISENRNQPFQQTCDEEKEMGRWTNINDCITMHQNTIIGKTQKFIIMYSPMQAAPADAEQYFSSV